jgi:Replication-relaxation
MTGARAPQRVRTRHVAWVAERLSERDWNILEAVNHLHLVTGFQLERLFFADLAGRSRIVTRSRCLSRLVAWRVLTRLPRRVGGALRGSSVAVYALGAAGQRLLVMRANSDTNPPPIRKVGVPSDRFVAHILAVTELYVCLAEANRIGSLVLRQFTTEPAAWWPNGQGTWLKPDAFFVVSNGRIDHLWWAEIDRATESLATIERKLRTYLNFVNRGGLGPRDAIPRVLLTVPNDWRHETIHKLAAHMPPPAPELFHVVLHKQEISWLTEALAR